MHGDLNIFKLSALLELVTGIALLLVPGTVLGLIVDVEPDQINTALSRLCGVALVSLALASGAVDLGGDSRRSALGLIYLQSRSSASFCRAAFFRN